MADHERAVEVREGEPKIIDIWSELTKEQRADICATRGVKELFSADPGWHVVRIRPTVSAAWIKSQIEEILEIW